VDIQLFDVIHGHKYAASGGFVQFNRTGSAEFEHIFFRLSNGPKPSTDEGVPVKEVYIVR